MTFHQKEDDLDSGEWNSTKRSSFGLVCKCVARTWGGERACMVQSVLQHDHLPLASQEHEAAQCVSVAQLQKEP